MQTQLLYSIIYLFFPFIVYALTRVCTGLVHAAQFLLNLVGAFCLRRWVFRILLINRSNKIIFKNAKLFRTNNMVDKILILTHNFM